MYFDQAVRLTGKYRGGLLFSGKSGLIKLREEEYQLVILDVMMPGPDGFETLEKIREESGVPVLMLTSKNDSASKVWGLREGANRQLMTSLSHDVRTPLTTQIGYLDAVHRGIVTDRGREDYIEFALRTDTVEVSELTKNILIDWVPIFEDHQIEYVISIPEKPFCQGLTRMDTGE